MQQDYLTPAAQRAAANARRLRPFSIILYAAASLGILFKYWIVPILSQLGPGFSFGDGLRQFFVGWIEGGSAIALAWTLWEADRYLQRIEKGELWGTSIMTLLRHIGIAFLTAVLWADIIAPSFTSGMAGHGWFTWTPQPETLVLAGLGLLFIVIARTIGDVMQIANELQASSNRVVHESSQINIKGDAL